MNDKIRKQIESSQATNRENVWQTPASGRQSPELASQQHSLRNRRATTGDFLWRHRTDSSDGQPARIRQANQSQCPAVEILSAVYRVRSCAQHRLQHSGRRHLPGTSRVSPQRRSLSQRTAERPAFLIRQRRATSAAALTPTRSTVCRMSSTRLA